MTETIIVTVWLVGTLVAGVITARQMAGDRGPIDQDPLGSLVLWVVLSMAWPFMLAAFVVGDGMALLFQLASGKREHD